jgi:uncharacterized SAM-binding protein YcdF (DUF218 family)
VNTAGQPRVPEPRLRTTWRRRILAATAGLLVLAAVSIALPSLRTPILETAGRALVFDSPLEPVDIVIVSIGAGGAGVLEAADLVQSGISRRVAVVADTPDAVDREFVRRGVPYDDAADQLIQQLRALGVERVERVKPAVTGTEDEGSLLPVWCAERHLRSALVVTTRDHSRRLARVLRRSMPSSVTAGVRGSRYSVFDPSLWWRSRVGIRVEMIEMQKLLLDIARHPIS